MQEIPGAKMVFKVVDRTGAPLKRMRRRFNLLSKSAHRAMKNSAKSYMKVGGVIAGTVAAVAGAALRTRGQTDDALGDLASVGIKKLGLLQKAAYGFTGQWSRVNRVQFLTAAYDIKSGISSLSDEGVAKMTKLAAMTGIATKGTTQEMTALFAQAYNIYRTQFGSDIEFGEKFSAGLSAAVKNFRTDGKEMSDAIANIQGIASGMGVGLAEQLTVLGTLRNTFKSGAEAGTAYKSMMIRLIEAGGKLGTKFTDVNGKALPMADIITKIEKAQAKAVAANQGAKFQSQLKAAFGDEGIKVLSAFMGKSKNLRESQKKIAAAMGKGSKYTKAMAKTRETGVGRMWERMANNASNLADALGGALAPAFLRVGQAVNRIMGAVTKWMDAHPRLTRAITITVGALGGLLFIIGAIKIAMFALNILMAFNPFSWVVLGVVAAVAAIAALIVYWDEIKAMFAEWGNRLERFGEDMGKLASGIGESLGQAWDWVVDKINSLLEALNPAALIKKGAALISGLWAGIKSKLEPLRKWIAAKIEGLVGWMPDWVKEKLGLNSTQANPDPGKPTSQGEMSDAVAFFKNSPEQVAAAQEARVKTESRTQLEVSFRNAPKGAYVSNVEHSGGDDFALAANGLNYAPGM